MLLRALTFMLLLLPGGVLADATACEDHVIEYTTFVSTIIPAEVAAAHDIVRGSNRIITNITVLKQGKSVDARVSGTATNLLNQVSKLLFRPVREKGTVYYLATLVVSRRDTIRYAVSVTPVGARQACRLHFIRNYYRTGSQ